MGQVNDALHSFSRDLHFASHDILVMNIFE